MTQTRPKDLDIRPTAPVLRDVALVYRLSCILGDSPTQFVAQALGLPRSTAGRWVMKARAAGYLGETQPRMKGEGRR